jgi:hypothetical protein
MPKKRVLQLKFETFGPFPLPRHKYQSGAKKGKFKRKIDQTPNIRRSFWQLIEKKHPGLPKAVGCYLFALGKVPWYVGKTEKLRFELETWQGHKIGHYESALATRKRAKPVLYLIAKRTPQGRFSEASAHRDIQFLENLMIGASLRRNEDLLNKRDTKYQVSSDYPRAGVYECSRFRSSKRCCKSTVESFCSELIEILQFVINLRLTVVR